MKGDADASVSDDDVRAGGSVLDGSEAEARVHGDIGGVGGEAHAGVEDGLGAQAGFNVGFHDGKFSIGGDLGASLGLGVNVGDGITVDPSKIAHTAIGGVEDGASDVGNLFSSL